MKSKKKSQKVNKVKVEPNVKNEVVEPVPVPPVQKRFGAKLPITPDLLSEVLGIHGYIVDVRMDPVSRTFDIYVLGDEKHFPEVKEGSYAPTCQLQGHRNVWGVLDKTTLVDADTGAEYPHKEDISELSNQFVNPAVQSIQLFNAEEEPVLTIDSNGIHYTKGYKPQVNMREGYTFGAQSDIQNNEE